MINYSPLPQRVRRIVKQYEYCVESVQMFGDVVNVRLKSGYITGMGGDGFMVGVVEKLIPLFKAVTKPSVKEIKVALYGFKCPICGCQVHKGSNYTALGGLNICTMCG